MQGVGLLDRDLLDAESVCGHLVRDGSVFAFLAGHRRDLFPGEVFADLFSGVTGRPSVPADVMAAVIVLQRLHGLSDRETAEADATGPWLAVLQSTAAQHNKVNVGEHASVLRGGRVRRGDAITDLSMSSLDGVAATSVGGGPTGARDPGADHA
jgi:hypothetical protein